MRSPGPDHDGDAVQASLRDRIAEIRALARKNDIRLVAAGVAFHLFNSLVPLLLFVFIGLSEAGQLAPAIERFGRVAGIDIGGFIALLDSIVGDEADRRRAAVIAGLILLWSSLRVVQAINVSFQGIYDVRHEHSLLGTVLDSVIVFATIIVVVPAVSLFVLALMIVADVPVVSVVSVPLLCVVVLVGVLPMYYRFSDPKTTLQEALPGAALAAVAWVLCAVGLRVYISVSQSVKLYGIVGGLLLLLTWLYIGGLMLLTGAALNAVLTDGSTVDAGDRSDR